MLPPRRRLVMRPAVLLLALCGLAGCAVEDSQLARRARTELLGMDEAELVACLGAPDQHMSIGSTDVLSWYATSTSSTSFAPPVVGGVSRSYGGYCHVSLRLVRGVVTYVTYSGEKNGTLAPNAYCAPILRSCIAAIDGLRGKPGAVVPATVVPLRTPPPAP